MLASQGCHEDENEIDSQCLTREAPPKHRLKLLTSSHIRKCHYLIKWPKPIWEVVMVGAWVVRNMAPDSLLCESCWKAPPDLLCENSQVALARFPWGNSSCRAPALRTDRTALSGFPSLTPWAWPSSQESGAGIFGAWVSYLKFSGHMGSQSFLEWLKIFVEPMMSISCLFHFHLSPPWDRQ